jgi:capsular polysaccharide biosynthesis protein
MSQRPLDLRKSIIIIRRFRVLVGVAAAVGLVVGVGYAALHPPAPTSTAVVSFPTSVQSTATQVLIADSDPVLSAAAADLNPPSSLAKLRGEVQVKSLTEYLISITASGQSGEDAVATANAVADSYISYVANKKSPVAHAEAVMFQPATGATASSRLEGILIAGLTGAVIGALIAAIASLAIGRKDRRLRERDQIANSIGVPVLGSVSVGRPVDPAGWAKLLESYQPQAVHAWQLRTVLRYLGITEQKFAQSPDDTAGRVMPDEDGDRVSVTVVSLSSDPRALALGPQLAVFAASCGIPTALLIGPQQDTDATAALRTACTTPLPSPGLPAGLHLAAFSDDFVDQVQDVTLTVVVVVVDGQTPKMPVTMSTAATVIGVSAGKVTAEQLARAAVAAGADGREVTGILVADPEETDKTTGRVPHLMRPPRRRLPDRLKGVVTEVRR